MKQVEAGPRTSLQKALPRELHFARGSAQILTSAFVSKSTAAGTPTSEREASRNAGPPRPARVGEVGRGKLEQALDQQGASRVLDELTTDPAGHKPEGIRPWGHGM